MSVVQPDEVQAAELGIKLPTPDMVLREKLAEAGQPVESGVDTIQIVPKKKPRKKTKAAKAKAAKAKAKTKAKAKPKAKRAGAAGPTPSPSLEPVVRVRDVVRPRNRGGSNE